MLECIAMRFLTQLPLQKALPALLIWGLFGSVPAAAEGPVTHVAYSDSGRYLGAASSNEFRLWNLQKPAETPLYFKHSALITHFSLSPQGDYALLVDDQGQYTVLDTARNTAVQTRQYPSANQSSDISPDGRWFAFGNRLGKLYVGQTSDWTVTEEAAAHHFSTKSLVFSPDSRYVYTGGWDQLVKRFEVGKLNEKKSAQIFSAGVKGIKAHVGMVNEVAVSPNGKYLLSGSFCDGAGNLSDPPPQDAVIRVWDTASKKPVLAHKITYGVTGTVFFPGTVSEKAYVIASSAGQFWGPLHEWDLKSGTMRPVTTEQGPLINVSSVAMHPLEDVAAIGTSEGHIRLLDRSTQKITKDIL